MISRTIYGGLARRRYFQKQLCDVIFETNVGGTSLRPYKTLLEQQSRAAKAQKPTRSRDRHRRTAARDSLTHKNDRP